MRVNHYWKASARTAAPSEIVVFDCETRAGPESSVPGGEFHTLRLGVALAYRLERGSRTRRASLRFRDGADLWRFVESRMSKQRPVWVFGHNLAYDVAAANLWPFLESEDFECEKAIMEGGVLLVEGAYKGMPIVLCDTFNYYKCSLAAIGRSLGLPKMAMPAWAAPDDEWFDYCARDVEVTAAAVDALIAFVRENALGPWQPTIASLAFSALRKRFLSHKVLVHTYQEPLILERAAYYGGIVDTPFIGDVPASPVHELDVVSMYPSVCRGPLPTVFRGYRNDPPLDEVARRMKTHFCIADVIIRSDRDTYPQRRGKRVLYVTGFVRTQLAHPELAEALDRRHVASVLAYAWYDRAPVFKEYMDFFTSKKGEYRAAGDEAFATIAKYYANSLYGKCGQMTPRWLPWNEDTFSQIAVENGLPPHALDRVAANPPDLSRPEEGYTISEHGIDLELRSIFGCVEVKMSRGESRDSVPAVAAAVTSYARCLLRSFQRAAGERNYFYSDTDSLWTNDAGLARLTGAGLVRKGELGFLDHVSTHNHMKIYGPKDYKTDRVEKIKGVRRDAGITSGGDYVQLQFPSPKSTIMGSVRGGVMVRLVVKRLRRSPDHCVVGADGWTRPFRAGCDDTIS